MYKGNYNNKKRRLRWNRNFVLMISIITLLIGVVGGSVAYLFTNTDEVVNTFTPGEVKITVDEEFGNDVKNNVKFTNTGNVDAKVRAMIVVTWQDANGNVYPIAPIEGTDYTINWTLSGWTGSGNGWYTHGAIAPNASTGILFTACKPVAGKTPEGYGLVVDVIAEAIQADGGASF